MFHAMLQPKSVRGSESAAGGHCACLTSKRIANSGAALGNDSSLPPPSQQEVDTAVDDAHSICTDHPLEAEVAQQNIGNVSRPVAPHNSMYFRV